MIARNAALGLLLAASAGAEVFGLRLDPFQSLQWEGNRICLSAPDGMEVFSSGEKPIHEIMAGPTRGAFAAIVGDAEIGVLLDRSFALLPRVFQEGSIVRSSTPEVVVAFEPSGREGGRFREIRAGARTRVLFETHEPIRDFDVTSTGVVVYLTGSGRTFLKATADAPLAVEAQANNFRNVEQASRVFVTSDGGEIDWLSSGQLFRLDLRSQRFQQVPFSAQGMAIVRTADTRAVRIESICAELRKKDR